MHECIIVFMNTSHVKNMVPAMLGQYIECCHNDAHSHKNSPYSDTCFVLHKPADCRSDHMPRNVLTDFVRLSCFPPYNVFYLFIGCISLYTEFHVIVCIGLHMQFPFLYFKNIKLLSLNGIFYLGNFFHCQASL